MPPGGKCLLRAQAGLQGRFELRPIVVAPSLADGRDADARADGNVGQALSDQPRHLKVIVTTVKATTQTDKMSDSTLAELKSLNTQISAVIKELNSR